MSVAAEPAVPPATERAAPEQRSFVRLAEIPPDALARVKEVRVDSDDAVRLKSLGICIGRRVQLVKGGDPLVVRVLGARVGMSARLAQGVFVEIV
jgi:Fe2+ transport system protein FeoA